MSSLIPGSDRHTVSVSVLWATVTCTRRAILDVLTFVKRRGEDQRTGIHELRDCTIEEGLFGLHALMHDMSDPREQYVPWIGARAARIMIHAGALVTQKRAALADGKILHICAEFRLARC